LGHMIHIENWCGPAASSFEDVSFNQSAVQISQHGYHCHCHQSLQYIVWERICLIHSSIHLGL
jgi:hypothetical protein